MNQEFDKIEERKQSLYNLQQRIITGVCFGLFAFLMMISGMIPIKILVSLLCFAMLKEMITIFEYNKIETIISYFYFIVHQTVLWIDYDFSFKCIPFGCFILFTFVSLYTNDILRSAKLFFAYYWSCCLLPYGIGIADISNSTIPVLYIVVIVCMSDGFQFLFGKLFGKYHPFTSEVRFLRFSKP